MISDKVITGNVVIITGGGQGIGKATAAHLLQAGMAVVIAEIDGEAGEETVAELAPLGPVQFLATDIADEAQVLRLVETTRTRFGRIDGLVNNAAISANRPLGELTLAEWNRVLAVNLTGAWLCAKYAAPCLRRQQGSIVNIASTRALMSEAHTEAYSASKGGLLSLTHALAVSLAPEVRVNCISPGWIETSAWKKAAVRREPELSEQDHQQHLVGRVGTPHDIATLIRYLLSPDSGFITGANFIVDGGMTKKMIYFEG